MDLDGCIKFANDNPVCYVATVDGDQPRVRAFGLWFADKTGFYFCTGAPKAVCRQLQANPRTEVCFYTPATPQDIGPMMRVAGKVEFLDDIALKTRILQEWPFLKDAGIKGPEDPMLVLFRIASGEASFWTMEAEMSGAEAEKIRF